MWVHCHSNNQLTILLLQVARTRDRPLASGEITKQKAIMFLGAQLGVSLAILLSLNSPTYVSVYDYLGDNYSIQKNASPTVTQFSKNVHTLQFKAQSTSEREEEGRTLFGNMQHCLRISVVPCHYYIDATHLSYGSLLATAHCPLTPSVRSMGGCDAPMHAVTPQST